MVKNLLLTISIAAAAILQGAPVLDRGGVTFDFKKISGKLFKPAAAVALSENLVTNPDGSAPEKPKDPLRWQPNYCYLHTNAIPAKDPRRARARKTVKWELKNGEFSIIKPDELKEFLPPDVLRSTSGGWRKVIDLPHNKGGLYTITFQYKGKLTSPGGAYLIIMGNTQKGGSWWKGKSPYFNVFRISLASEYQNYKNELLLPAGINSIELVHRIDGAGLLTFRNVAVTAKKKAPGAEKVTLQLSPMGRLDHTFALAQNLPGTITYVWKRNCAPADLKLKKPQLVMLLPREISLLDVATLKYLGKKESAAGVEHRVDLTPWRRRPEVMSSFDGYLRMGILLSTKAAPGSKLAQGKAWVEDGGKRVSNIINVNYKIIPEFKAAKPEFFMPGFYTGGIYNNFKTPQSLELCAKMYDAAGVRWIIDGGKAAYPIWRKKGIRYITPELYFIANGFRVGPPEGRPEADKYRYLGDQNKSEMERSTCPAAVYEKRPFFLKSTVPYIRKNLAGADGLWANWEPYYYAGRGCFCDTCCKKFAKFVNVPLEQMKKEWPQELARNRKYHDQAVKFRSLEHAKLMNTLNEVITAATGGKGKSLGFIPGVQVDNMSSTWRKNGFDKETHPIDYAGNFDWIDPWGPYAYWYSHNPFVYNKGFNLRTYLKARDVRAAVNKDYKKAPKLLAFPHGMQGNDWVTQPESLTIELLSFMFNGWEGATVYAYPKGYDARYWKAFADAADIAAKYDKYVFKGKKADNRISISPIAPYAAPTAVVEPLLGTYTTQNMLQYNAYELGNTLVAAVFNFWRDGEVFFTFKVKGAAPERRYTVKKGNFRFTNEKGNAFTGRELAKGIMLHAGAVRCAVYEIAPETAADRKLASFTAAAVKKAQKEALPRLRKAKAEDEKYEKINGLKEFKLADISNAGIICKADNKGKRLLFSAGKNSAEFFAGASCVGNWSVNGKKVIHGGAVSGVGAVALWSPSLQLARNFTVISQKKIKGGIEVVTERRLLDRDDPAVSGAIIRQTLRFTDGLTKISVDSSFINDAERTLSFGIRYNIMPAFPGLDKGFTRISSKGKSVEFKRDMCRRLFTTGIDKFYEKTVRKLFGITMPDQAIDAKGFSFIAPGAKATLSVKPESALAGVAVWDAGNQTAGTFEPCFKYMELGPGGKSFNFSAVMKVEK